MPAGRPPEPVPQDKANEILAWIADGKPLREWCRTEGNPTFVTVYNWLDKDKEFALRFAQAREVGQDVIAQECLEIADNGENDWMERTGKKGESIGWMVNGEAVLRSRLRVDTRLKLLAKWNPKKWGDKLQTEHTGELGIKTILVPSAPKDKGKRPKAAPAFDSED